jgi:hypothetical protein
MNYLSGVIIPRYFGNLRRFSRNTGLSYPASEISLVILNAAIQSGIMSMYEFKPPQVTPSYISDLDNLDKKF